MPSDTAPLTPIATSPAAAPPDRSDPGWPPYRSGAAAAPSSPAAAVALAGAGPLAIGAALAARLHHLEAIAVVPALLLATTAITVPALYIMLAALGAAPPVAEVARAVGRALVAVGLVELGLAGPVVFLSSTAVSPVSAVLFTAAALVAGLLVGLRVLRRGLVAGAERSPTCHLVITVWAVVPLVIGGRLFHEFARAVLS